jgi:hypothetical protein
LDVEIANYLNQLQGKYVSNIGRAANIIWLNFTDAAIESEYSGKDILPGLLCLHIQCPCRLVDKENRRIIFASSDIFVPSSTIEWSENFEWDNQGDNLFDEKSKQWLLSNREVYINDYKLNILGDLKLNLSNGNIFEVLINSSSNDECWRLFEKNSDEDHFVVSGQKSVFEYE